MKKMIFVITVFFALVFVISGTRAHEKNVQVDEKLTDKEKPQKPDVKQPNNEEVKIPDKENPNKTYELKQQITKDMVFERTETIISQHTTILTKVESKKQRIVPGYTKTSIEKLKYTILEIEKNKSVKFKIDIPKFKQKMGGNIFSNIYPEADLKPTKEYIIVTREKKDKNKIEEYSSNLAELVEDEKSMFIGMKENRCRIFGGGSKDFEKRLDLELSKEYQPNTLSINKIRDKLMFPDFYPEKPVTVGDSWEIVSAKQRKGPGILGELTDKKLTGFMGGMLFFTHKISFTLEKIELIENDEYAIISLQHNFCNGLDENERRDFFINGRISMNLTKNRIESIKVTVKLLCVAKHKAFGKYEEKTITEHSFVYKYFENDEKPENSIDE